MKKILLIFPFITSLLAGNYLNAQETVGLLKHESELLQDGFTLFSPLGNSLVYLVDNCGNLINEWTFNGAPRAIPYLLENGNLLRSGSEGIEIRDWNNSVVWSYDLTTQLNLRQHHDIEPMPNGNILAIIREFISTEEQIALGKNPILATNELKSEKIIEFKPIGTSEIEIIWEWRFADHLIQDYDDTKSNYGDVANHPELIDFNYEDYNMVHADWIHMNGIDYNSDLDQIIMSSKSLGEIYIIDHSTTTEEASSHLEGNYNKGGDFLWRWGNPEVYRQGTEDDRKLFEQHDPKWITKGYINESKITVFNNDIGATQTYSSINIITPVPIASGYEISDNMFNPADFFWSWNGEVINEIVFEPTRSGVIALPNGNMLFCESSKGRVTEVSPEGNILWIYRNPSTSTGIIDQFSSEDEIINQNNKLFRSEKYPSNYSGFIGKDLSSRSIIENVNSISNTCSSGLSLIKSELNMDVILINNPILNAEIEFNKPLISANVYIYTLNGNIIFERTSFNGKKLQLPKISSGIYILRLENKNNNHNIKFVKR